MLARSAVAVLLATAPSLATAQRAPVITLPTPSAIFDDPDQLFTAVTSIRELTDGRLLVADRAENRLALIDFARKRSMQVGRPGSGPGEYSGIGWLYPLHADWSLLTDRQARRWFILDGPTITETVPADRPLNRLFGPALAGTDTSGNVLGLVGVAHSGPNRPMRDNADSLALILAARVGTKHDTVGRIRGRGAAGVCIIAAGGGPNPVAPCNLLATEDLAVLFPDGWIAVARSEPYHVDWRDPNGNWVRGAPLAEAPARLTEADKCLFLAPSRSGPAGAACDPSRYAWPQTVPPFLSLLNRGGPSPNSPAAFATPGGNLLIRRTATASSESARYDLLNRGGRLTAIVLLQRTDAVVGFGKASIYIAESTADGLYRLRRHTWPLSADRD